VQVLSCGALYLMVGALKRIGNQRLLTRAEAAQLRAFEAVREEIFDEGPRIKQLFRDADRCTQRGIAVFELIPINCAVPPGPAWEPFRVSAHHSAWLMLSVAQQRVRETSPDAFNAISLLRTHVEATVGGRERARGKATELLKAEEQLFFLASAAVRGSGIVV
jgi:hypothetical protein